MRHAALRVALAATALGAHVVGQSQPLFTFVGEAADDRFGYALGGAGDVNGDGIGDLIVGAFRNDGNGSESGGARVFSGADGSTLHTLYGDASGDWFGLEVAGAGDVNGDGFADFLVSSPNAVSLAGRKGRVRVFSGVDGAVLHEWTGGVQDWLYGYAVAAAGDVNVDGFDDVMVGAPAEAQRGSVRIYSGLDGSVLRQIMGPVLYGNFGWSLDSLGDINFDGVPDQLVGAPTASGAYPTNSGSAHVHSGADGSELFAFHGGSQDDFLGHRVSAAGDVNNDGIGDLLVSAPYETTGVPWLGAVRVYSGRSGSVLHLLHGESEGDRFGTALSGAGDIDGDGYDDFMVGALYAVDPTPLADQGRAEVFSGRTGAMLRRFEGEGYQEHLGTVCTLGDIDGDGLADFAVGASEANAEGVGHFSGRVRVYSGRDPSLYRYCFGNDPLSPCPCGNDSPFGGCANLTGVGAELAAQGSTSLAADDLQFLATELLPGAQSLLFAGTNVAGAGGGIPFGDGLRCAGGQLTRLGVRTASFLGTAVWGPGLSSAQNLSPGDQRFYQVWYRDINGGPCTTAFNLTNGVAVTYGL